MNVFGILKTLVIFALSFLVFLEFPLFVGGMAAKNTLLNDEFYLNEFERQQVYATAKDYFVQFAGEMELGSGISKEQQGQLVEKLSDAVPESYLANQTSILFKNAFSYVKGEKDSLSLIVDFRPIKPSLSKAASDALFDNANTQYAGEEFALPQIPGVTPSGCNDLASCLQHCRLPQNSVECSAFFDAAGVSGALMPSQLSSLLGGGGATDLSNIDSLIENQIPDTLDLTEQLGASGAEQFAQVRSYVKTANLAFLIIFLLILVELSLLAVLEWDVWRAGKRVSLLILSCAVSSAVPAVFILLFGAGFVRGAIPADLQATPLAQKALAIALDLQSEVAMQILIYSVIVLLIGGGLYTAVHFGKKKYGKETEEKEKEEKKEAKEEKEMKAAKKKRER